MSNQFRYLLSAEQVIATLLRSYPEAEAMERAVGGDFERFGVLEHAVLREAGLTPESNVVDVGCGSGRLATQLSRHAGLRYLGTDVVPAMLEYARRRTARPDFRFIHVDRVGIPAPDASADIVAFFSVLTHLLHEESFLYLEEAHRVLKPGGKVVFSFLEYDTPIGWTVFKANLDWVRRRIVASQINVFLHRGDIRQWARRLGFRVELLRSGEPGSVTVSEAEATPTIVAGPHAFGQSLCVLRKPGPTDTEEGGPAGTDRSRNQERKDRRTRSATDAAALEPGEKAQRDAGEDRAARRVQRGEVRRGTRRSPDRTGK